MSFAHPRAFTLCGSYAPQHLDSDLVARLKEAVQREGLTAAARRLEISEQTLLRAIAGQRVRGFVATALTSRFVA